MEAQILPLSSQGVWGINPECRQEALKIRNLSLQDELRSWIPWLNFAKAQGSTAACQILPGFEHISLIQIRGTAICTYQDSCGLSLKLGDGPGACFGAGVRDRWNCDRAYKLSQGCLTWASGMPCGTSSLSSYSVITAVQRGVEGCIWEST
ncbi:uncharacterized protein GJ701_003045 isoform 2-T2 [Geothlypis trichas]